MTTAALTGPAVTASALAIDEAARTIATTSGLTAITLRRVVSVSGLAPAVVALHEPSMSALAARTFSDLAGAEYDKLRARVDAAPSPTEAVRTLVGSMLVSDDSLSKTIWADVWSIARHNDFVASAARKQMIVWQELAVSVLEAGTASGDFNVTNPVLAARQFFALIDSTTVYGLVGYLDEHERVELVTRSVEVSIGLPEGILSH